MVRAGGGKDARVLMSHLDVQGERWTKLGLVRTSDPSLPSSLSLSRAFKDADINRCRIFGTRRNAAWNAFTALIDIDTTTLLHSSPFADPLIRRLMAEIASVSRALGIEIDPLSHDALPSAKAKLAAEKGKAEGAGEKEKEKEERLDDKLINRVLAVGPLTSSMRTDVQSARSLEVEVCLLLSSLSFSLSLLFNFPFPFSARCAGFD